MKNLMKTLTVGAVAAAALLMNAVSVNTASAATVYGNDGLLYGNICQTPYGWQVVPWRLVGASCYSPSWNSYGYILNG